MPRCRSGISRKPAATIKAASVSAASPEARRRWKRRSLHPARLQPSKKWKQFFIPRKPAQSPSKLKPPPAPPPHPPRQRPPAPTHADTLFRRLNPKLFHFLVQRIPIDPQIIR